MQNDRTNAPSSRALYHTREGDLLVHPTELAYIRGWNEVCEGVPFDPWAYGQDPYLAEEYEQGRLQATAIAAKMPRRLLPLVDVLPAHWHEPLFQEIRRSAIPPTRHTFIKR